MKNMKKTVAMTSVLVSGALVFGAMPASAAAPTGPASSALPPVTLTPERNMGGFTSADWMSIARTAEKAGDMSGANAARAAAVKTGPGSSAGGGGAQPANMVTALAKKALVAALRHAGPKLPKKIRPYANKLANTLDDITNFQEGALIVAFQQAGIPYDVASAAATWCVVFLGF